MSMEDRTNETILLSLHKPLDEVGVHHAAELAVDHDSDSSFTPAHWVAISLTDAQHDSDTVRLTEEEAGLLHDRLGLILGRNAPAIHDAGDVPTLTDSEWRAFQDMPRQSYFSARTWFDGVPASRLSFRHSTTPESSNESQEAAPQYLDAELCGHDRPEEGDGTHVAGDQVDLICLASPLGGE